MAKSKLRLEVTRFELSHIFGIDLGHVIGHSEMEFNLLRGTPGWLNDLKVRFDKAGTYGFEIPYFDESEYSKTDRVGRNTFSPYFAFNLMPLSFELSNPTLIKEKFFSCLIKNFRVGPKGSLSIRIDTTLNNNKPVSVDSLIDLYFRYRVSLKNRLHTHINNFIKCWNAHINEFQLAEVTFDEIESYVHHYEVIDFDYRIMPGNQSMSMVEIFEHPETQILKQLAGLSRMSPTYNNYADSKLISFKDNDISNRDDELWVINLERLLRYHPESKKNIYVDSFFTDVKLGFEIILQQEISLEYLSAWINKKRAELRIKLSTKLLGDKSVNEKEIQSILGEITNLSDIFSSQFIIQRNIKHSFYNAVFLRAFEVLSIEKIIKQTKESFNDLFSIYSVYSSQKISNISLSFEEANLQLNKSVERLTLWVVVMTFIMLSFGALQLYTGLNSTSSNNKLVHQPALEINNQEVIDETPSLEKIPNKPINAIGSDALEDAHE